MSEPLPEGLSPYQIARSEIDSWRGRCLDLCARSERAVAQALEAAESQGQPVTLRHLAGQRLDDLLALVNQEDATARQRETLANAIARWRKIEGCRVFLAHGIVRELLDRKGEWHAHFELTTYKANTPTLGQMTISRTEALKLQEELEKAFKTLSAQLGQYRKRLIA